MAAASGATAAIANEVKAGTVVRVIPEEFARILARQPGLLVVTAEERFFSTKYRYLTSYKGMIFFSESPIALSLPSDIELVIAKKIWIP